METNILRLSRLLSISIIATFMFSCNDLPTKPVLLNQATAQPAFNNAKVDDKLLQMTKIFIDSLNCKDCVVKVFIDKVYDDKTIITFKGSSDSGSTDLPDHAALLYYFSGRPMYVFSGIEDLIKIDTKAAEKKKTLSNKFPDTYLRLSFTLEADSFHLDPVNNLPFGLPLKMGPQPDIDVNKFK